MQATGHVLEDGPAVRPAMGYTVQPAHWTGALALITLVFTVQPVQVAQSHVHIHTPLTTHQHHNTTHHTPLHHSIDATNGAFVPQTRFETPFALPPSETAETFKETLLHKRI